MKRLGGLLLILLCVVACGVGLYISAANRDIVVYDLLFWPEVSLRSGLVVVLAFVAGAIAGLLVGTLASASRRVQGRWSPVRRGNP